MPSPRSHWRSRRSGRSVRSQATGGSRAVASACMDSVGGAGPRARPCMCMRPRSHCGIASWYAFAAARSNKSFASGSRQTRWPMRSTHTCRPRPLGLLGGGRGWPSFAQRQPCAWPLYWRLRAPWRGDSARCDRPRLGPSSWWLLSSSLPSSSEGAPVRAPVTRDAGWWPLCRRRHPPTFFVCKKVVGDMSAVARSALSGAVLCLGISLRSILERLAWLAALHSTLHCAVLCSGRRMTASRTPLAVGIASAAFFDSESGLGVGLLAAS
jgi:hypothetical protein